MQDVNYSIASITPTICSLMGAPFPYLSSSKVITPVTRAAKKILGNQSVDKCFIYAPDAIGESLFKDYTHKFEDLIKISSIQVLLKSVMPSVTPVCFASMFTGATPNMHGITSYEKPVLKCDTLFDAILRSDKRVALIAVEGSSIAKIFLERDMDYFIEKYDPQVNSKATQIMKKNEHELFLIYNQAYDDASHKTWPRSQESIKALATHICSFIMLSKEFIRVNKRSNRLIVFAPDHGAHLDPDTGKGSHGLDIYEDMVIRSFWGIYPSQK